MSSGISTVKPAGERERQQPEQEENARSHQQLEAMGKRYQYHYRDKKTFAAALELYARHSCILSGYSCREWTPRCDYEIKQVRGVHKIPCWQCSADFNGLQDYLEHDTIKVCVGRMGRNLRYKYGSRKAIILIVFDEWRQKQEQVLGADGIMNICHIKFYDRKDRSELDIC